jgi:D-alanyl-D-alanine carboxypeptidase/D-alanyl-D-alanine-endopeptidase (penicillin-binding protein 4)
MGRALLAAAGSAAMLAGAAEPALPASVALALQRADVPPSALSVRVEEAGSGRVLLRQHDDAPVNPASLAKLVTTYAALDRLGPAWHWETPVWLDGPVRDGVLEGDLVIRGSGDPSLVVERLWLLLRQVQQAGVRTIRGDIVTDGSAFAPSDAQPGDFDGEALRPYNVQPDALLLNYKSSVYGFVPDRGEGRARVSVLPGLAGAEVERSVPLTDGPCADWRGGLKASFDADGKVRFAGRYAAACGAQAWPVADPQPATYNARLLAGLWQEMGGRLTGRVREGRAPQGPPSFRQRSPDLAEVVRDINKYSNNLMAQQLFLTLAAQADPATPATSQAARAWLRLWLQRRLGDLADEVLPDNGAGLSRDGRLTARALAALLQHAWRSPVMPELVASLPVSGLDGTLRRARLTPGRAHLKTGSLRDVQGVAGYVLADDGRRLVVVALINHANAGAARPALEALVQWAVDGAPPG